MGFLYMRRDSRLWWVCWTDPSGERRRESTGLTDLGGARRMLEDLERRSAELRRRSRVGDLTVEARARHRVEVLAGRGDRQASEDAVAVLSSLSPALAGVPLRTVRHRHVMEWMRWLGERRSPGAPPARTLYVGLYRLFEDAVADELIASNPCLADRHGASGVQDLERQLSNHFSREELERLLTDPRVDPFRRCQWAVLALTGARIGEVLCLRVRHCDLSRRPLGRLLFAGRWDSKLRCQVPSRSGVPREVPVHRTLAVLLAGHLGEVLPARVGHPVEPDDLLFPAQGGGPQQAGTTLSHLQRDLELLGIRRGNLHTLRRTYFALGRMDGASPRVLRSISEDGRSGDPDLPFPALCAEISRLDVELARPEGEPFLPPDGASGEQSPRATS